MKSASQKSLIHIRGVEGRGFLRMDLRGVGVLAVEGGPERTGVGRRVTVGAAKVVAVYNKYTIIEFISRIVRTRSEAL